MALTNGFKFIFIIQILQLFSYGYFEDHNVYNSSINVNPEKTLMYNKIRPEVTFMNVIKACADYLEEININPIYYPRVLPAL